MPLPREETESAGPAAASPALFGFIPCEHFPEFGSLAQTTRARVSSSLRCLRRRISLCFSLSGWYRLRAPEQAAADSSPVSISPLVRISFAFLSLTFPSTAPNTTAMALWSFLVAVAAIENPAALKYPVLNPSHPRFASQPIVVCHDKRFGRIRLKGRLLGGCVLQRFGFFSSSRQSFAISRGVETSGSCPLPGEGRGPSERRYLSSRSSARACSSVPRTPSLLRRSGSPTPSPRHLPTGR